MLTEAQNKAVALLFEHTDDEVSRKLRIKRETLDSWLHDPEFSRELQENLAKNRETAARIVSRLCVEAARELQALVRSDDDKNKPRALIEILKVSGLLKESAAQSGDPIAGLVDRLSEDADDEED